jgi:hypothetical protein
MPTPFESAAFAKKVCEPTPVPLSQVNAALLSRLAARDARKLLYSSIVSISDAIAGFEVGRSSWGGVQLYYALLYIVRAMLANDGLVIFYSGRRGSSLEAVPGGIPARSPNLVSGSTHKFAFWLYERRFARSRLLDQQIESLTPFQWMMDVREFINYRSARFPEPSSHKWFSYVIRGNVRKLVNAYLDDNIYAFDPEHAILAYPLFALQEALGGLVALDDVGIPGDDLAGC